MNETQFDRTGNPFPGLRPFETDEYNLFFGREGQSDELLARLGRTRFLAVVGTSGSGKSSLIRAGLIPAIYGGLMSGAGSSWRIAVMRPGHDPVGNLAQALSLDEVLGSPEMDDDVEATIIETTLRRSTLGVVDAVRQARLPASIGVHRIDLAVSGAVRLERNSRSVRRPARHTIAVRVIDDGHGIPEDIKGRIFDPFFTTKPVGAGTGMGLDIVRRLVFNQKGDIDVESRPGYTVFRVILPVATGPVTPASTPAAPAAAPVG